MAIRGLSYSNSTTTPKHPADVRQQAILDAARQLRDAAYEFWEVPDPPRGATLAKAITAFDRAIGGGDAHG